MATSPNIFKNRSYGSWTTYMVAIALTILACAVAVILRLFSVTDLPFQTFAALIGVIITAIITGVLLKGQSDAEREQKEKAEIFKEKLSSYNRFLNALCAYVTNSTPRNKKALIFHTIAIKMHCNGDDMARHYVNVTRILQSTGNDNSEETSALIDALNEIAVSFRKELYGVTSDDSQLATIIERFTTAIDGSQEEPSEKEKEADTLQDEKEDIALQDSKLISWDSKVKELASKGWNLTTKSDEIKLTSVAVPVVLSIYRKKGRYVIEASKPDDNDFSKRLKENFKGARRYGTWWRELPINNYGVTEGTLLTQLPSNERARASVIKWIDKVIKSL